MKIINKQTQLIVRNENLNNQEDLKDYIIYGGLGHVVLDSDKLIAERKDLFDKIKADNVNNYFFRFSISEDMKEDKYRVRSYLSTDLDYFKPKYLQTKDIYYFLGVNMIIIDVEKISTSKNFNEVGQYRCIIKSITIDNNDGTIQEEEIWNKTKYGYIESFLPSKLEKFKPFVESARLRLNKI